MANTNPVMDVLKPYIDQEANRDELLAKAVLGSKTRGYMTLQTGVKGPTTINLLSTEFTFGDGSTCGFEDNGSVTISQRQIVPATMKVNLSLCEKNLLGTYAQYNVKLKAGLEEMPFEEYILSEVAKKVQNKLETFTWQGDSDEEETQFDGLLKIITAEGSGAVKVTAGSTEHQTVLNVYKAIPEEAHTEDMAIFTSPAKFRAWVQELVASNLYHWNANDKADEYTIPGTNMKVIAVPGLTGTSTYVAANKDNLFYGVDIEDAAEEIKVVYDEVKENFLIKMLFNAGVQVAFPEHIVYVG